MVVKQEVPLAVRTIRLSDAMVDGLKKRAAKVGQSWTEYLRALAGKHIGNGKK